MKKVFAFLFLLLTTVTFSQSSSKINNAQNVPTSVPNPSFIIGCEPLPAGTWQVYYKSALTWDYTQINGLTGAVQSIGDIRYKPLSYLPDWTDITGKPSFFNGDYNSLSNRPFIPTNTNDLTNGAGFISSEIDPTVPSYVKSITTSNISQWNSSYPNSNPSGFISLSSLTWTNIIGKPTTLTGYGITDAYPSSNPSGFISNLSGLTTTNLSEGSNLYWTLARFNTAFAGKSTSDLLEGTNLYYTSTRFNTAFSNKTTSDLTEGSNLYWTQSRFNTAFSSKNTDGLLEGSSNFYFTNSRARLAINLTTTGSGAATYDSSTGNLNIPTNTPVALSFNNSATKTLNGAGVQLSTTRDAFVSYSITHNVVLTLAVLNGSSQAYLEISPNNTTWTTISQAGFSRTLALSLAINDSSVTNIQGVVPAGWYIRIRSVVSGGGSASFTFGQEVLK